MIYLSKNVVKKKPIYELTQFSVETGQKLVKQGNSRSGISRNQVPGNGLSASKQRFLVVHFLHVEYITISIFF